MDAEQQKGDQHHGILSRPSLGGQFGDSYRLSPKTIVPTLPKPPYTSKYVQWCGRTGS
jgi:hypothetical protein